MKALLSSFREFCNEITKDSMLIVIILSPILMGIAFKFGIPVLENMLTEYFGKNILTPYYLIFDILLATTTPYMFCFASAMVILEEIDTGLTNYLSVTPIGKSGYIISRLLFPAAISAVFSIIILIIFSLTNIFLIYNFILSILSAAFGITIALLIVSLSSNKVEGMAIAKLNGLVLIGIPIAFFIKGKEQYFGSFLPSFWITKFILDGKIHSIILAVFTTVFWYAVLYRRFMKKIM